MAAVLRSLRARLVREQPDFLVDAAWRPSLRRGTAVAEDGTRLAYEVVGNGERVLLMANGLGGRLYAWTPLLDAFHRDYTLVTWDYRGLFDSGTPSSRRRLSLTDHVADALTIARAEHVKRAVFVGWSMGVQVSLDLAATHPDLCAGLVLMNGTYGHIFSTGFQPLFAVPALPKRLHAIVEMIRKRPMLADLFAVGGRALELPTTALFGVTSGTRALTLRPMLRRYMDDVLGPSFESYLRLFQELDAHSVYHLLPEIDAPALVVSGLFDFLTPARQSYEIARRLPFSEHLPLWRASHFALLERPEAVVPAIATFLDRRARWG